MKEFLGLGYLLRGLRGEKIINGTDSKSYTKANSSIVNKSRFEVLANSVEPEEVQYEIRNGLIA